MKILVDVLPSSCEECLFEKSFKCTLCKKETKKHWRLDECPLVSINFDLKVNVTTQDFYEQKECYIDINIGDAEINKVFYI